MFTGIVEAIGRIKAVSKGGLEVSVPAGWALSAGESVAVSGACLTVTASGKGLASFAVSPETFSRTRLGALKPGAAVNLERALAVGARLGGHFVTGHVDGAARLLSVRNDGNSRLLDLERGAGSVLVEKGSVALDGVSLTVYEVKPSSFKVSVIPHTWENTTLKDLKPGALLNVEYDILGKYAAAGPKPSPITPDFLKSNGFMA